MFLGADVDVHHNPASGHVDKDFHGRYNGVWVVSADTERRARQMLFQFHNRLRNRRVFPTLSYMVRAHVGVDYCPTLHLDEARRIADDLGGQAHVMAIKRVNAGQVGISGVLYRAEGTYTDPQTQAVNRWARVDPARLRLGDVVELPPTDTRSTPLVVRLAAYTGRQDRGRTAEFVLANLRGERLGTTDLPLDTPAVLVFDSAWEEAGQLNELWDSAATLAGAGLLGAQAFDRVRHRVQGDSD